MHRHCNRQCRLGRPWPRDRKKHAEQDNRYKTNDTIKQSKKKREQQRNSNSGTQIDRSCSERVGWQCDLERLQDFHQLLKLLVHVQLWRGSERVEVRIGNDKNEEWM